MSPGGLLRFHRCHCSGSGSKYVTPDQSGIYLQALKLQSCYSIFLFAKYFFNVKNDLT